MERIRIPNAASYFPISLADLFLVAPLASRILLRATLPGRFVSAFALGAYAGSAALDWASRLGVRKIDFLAHFGADVRTHASTPSAVRERDTERLAAALKAGHVPMEVPRDELARRVNRRLTEYIAGITGQRVETSARVRDFMLAQLAFPFALGACDPVTGDVALFQRMGIFEPHVLAHEFTHRKGYWKELEAQVLAYLALADSGDPVLVQSARAERLYRQLWVLARRGADGEGEEIGEPGSAREAPRRGPAAPAADPTAPGLGERYVERVRALELGPELEPAFLARAPAPSAYDRAVGRAIRELYDLRMRLTGQNGLTDYDEGFTDFLYTAESGDFLDTEETAEG